MHYWCDSDKMKLSSLINREREPTQNPPQAFHSEVFFQHQIAYCYLGFKTEKIKFVVLLIALSISPHQQKLLFIYLYNLVAVLSVGDCLLLDNVGY